MSCVTVQPFAHNTNAGQPLAAAELLRRRLKRPDRPKYVGLLNVGPIRIRYEIQLLRSRESFAWRGR